MALRQLRNRQISPGSASNATFALNVASNFLRDFVISLAPSVKQSRTLHTLTAGPKTGVHFTESK